MFISPNIVLSQSCMQATDHQSDTLRADELKRILLEEWNLSGVENKMEMINISCRKWDVHQTWTWDDMSVSFFVFLVRSALYTYYYILITLLYIIYFNFLVCNEVLDHWTAPVQVRDCHGDARWLLAKLRDRPVFSHRICAFKCLVVLQKVLQSDAPMEWPQPLGEWLLQHPFLDCFWG